MHLMYFRKENRELNIQIHLEIQFQIPSHSNTRKTLKQSIKIESIIMFVAVSYLHVIQR